MISISLIHMKLHFIFWLNIAFPGKRLGYDLYVSLKLQFCFYFYLHFTSSDHLVPIEKKNRGFACPQEQVSELLLPQYISWIDSFQKWSYSGHSSSSLTYSVVYTLDLIS